MMPEEEFDIRQAKEPVLVAECALLMFHSDPWVTLKMQYEYCLNAFDGENREVFVMEAGHKLVGFVIMQTQGSFKGYIQTICVAESWRGKGIGTRLLQFCENRILTYSPNIFICVSSFNEGAIRLYESFGFKRVGELENFVKEGYTELLYRKTAGPIQGYKQ
jgi:ribosomal protein S18 acetylase RimI-like enzyme